MNTPCTNCGTYKIGLLDENTVCPDCNGSGLVGEAEEAEKESMGSSYKELKAKAKELDIKVKVTMSKEDLQAAIAEAEQPKEVETPEKMKEVEE